MLNNLLKDYFSSEKLDALKNITINGLSLDSREVETGHLFFAVSGETVNGVEFINSAIEKGAAAVVWEASENTDAIDINWRKTVSEKDVPIIAITNLSQLIGELADRFYEHPSEHIYVCGITGTNGKTSCASFIAQVMSVEGTCGLLGTLGSGIYPEVKETGFTTPSAIACHQWLADINSVDANFAVMEVSSHALTQGRVNGIHFDSAVFTNLSRDHLDFHGDMDSYAMAKSKLFKFPKLKNAIINVDDEAGRKIVTNLSGDINCIRYGLDDSFSPEVFGSEIKLDQHGLSMYVTTPWGEGRFTSSLMGHFNASNLLAVLSVMLVEGVEFNEALTRISNLENVAGRMQHFGGDSMPLVVVDFAHTPDALEQVLISLREHTQNKLWCVFGCGGDRDKGKRPLMGAIADNNADYVVLTSDNPRSEVPEDIIKDIQVGMKGASVISIESDRHAAIHYAISEAKAGDVILIAGKGHENYQLIGDEKFPFNDVDEVKQQLEACAV